MGSKFSGSNTQRTGEDDEDPAAGAGQSRLGTERNEAEEAVEEACEEEAEETHVDESEGKKVAERREEIEEILRDELSVEEQHIFGSLTRDTMVGPLDEDSDTDVMFVLDKNEHGDWADDNENGPKNCLRKVKRVLQNDPRFKDADVSIDRNVVAVKFNEFTVEVAPAFKRGDDYEIPNTYRDGSAWVRTNPRRYKQQFNAVNENRNGNLAKLARLAKKYNESTGKQVSSYHMEVMVYDFMRTRQQGDESMSRLIEDFYEELPERLSSGTYDPATNQRVDDGLQGENREQAIADAQKAREKLREASERKRQNDDTEVKEDYKEVVNGDLN